MNISPETSIDNQEQQLQEDNTGLAEIQAALEEIEKLKNSSNEEEQEIENTEEEKEEPEETQEATEEEIEAPKKKDDQCLFSSTPSSTGW
jgi:predicted ribosome quality control (RQC) complex YloA/Tae2 family protein